MAQQQQQGFTNPYMLGVNELEMAKLLDCVRYGTMEDRHDIHMMKPVDVGTLIVMQLFSYIPS